MTKKEMIEDMAKAMYGYICKDRHCEKCNYNGGSKILEPYCNSYINARTLYEAGYRKIPEGAVVLSREEWESLQIEKDFNYGYHEGEKNMESYYENFVLPKARKEMAREFASFVKSKLFDLGNIVNERDIDDMLKEFQ